MISGIETWESGFGQLSARLMDQLRADECLSLELVGENSQFIRFNRARVRQTGVVSDCQVKLTLFAHQRTAYADFPLTGHAETDLRMGGESLDYLRREIAQLPEDPFLVLPVNQGSTREVYTGELLSPDLAAAEILSPVAGLDFTGFYAGGAVIRANFNSLGQQHWFSTESFFLDYSLIGASEKAVKRVLADRHWNPQGYQEQIAEAKNQLQLLQMPIHEVKRGRYRTYFAPAATADLIGMLSWGGVSEASLRQGGSALAKMRQGKTLSPLFSLQENFEAGNVPRFNELGELAPMRLPIIVEGHLTNSLVSSRTAKEYGVAANGASRGEGLRSPAVRAGAIPSQEILKVLDTGLYLSNLHYLNWSDRANGRITGMTRYACFWVEGGEIIAPIRDLRFDDSLYSFWGENLLGLTAEQEFIPETGTYEHRSLGGQLMPGLLVADFTFTL